MVLYVTHDIEEALLLADRVLVMSGQPGRIREEIWSPFGRPRDLTGRTHPELEELKWHIWSLLEGEVRQHLHTAAAGVRRSAVKAGGALVPASAGCPRRSIVEWAGAVGSGQRSAGWIVSGLFFPAHYLGDRVATLLRMTLEWRRCWPDAGPSRSAGMTHWRGQRRRGRACVLGLANGRQPTRVRVAGSIRSWPRLHPVAQDWRLLPHAF